MRGVQVEREIRESFEEDLDVQVVSFPMSPHLDRHVVHADIQTGRIQVVRGGPNTGKNAPGPDKLKERTLRAEMVSNVVKKIKEIVAERMKGVDQHCLRMTHRTWALMAGVPEILIDRQLGHTSPGGDAALKAAWSLVGRGYYTDMNMLAGDARRSAEAVREMLDRAEAELAEAVSAKRTALVPPGRKESKKKRRKKA